MRRMFRRVLVLTISLWTAVCAGALVYHLNGSRHHVEQLARQSALEHVEKDLLYRHWAASLGGIYVPVTEQTPPNPYLAPYPERDITTPSGRKLTLVNPAYMTRQVYEMARDFTEIQGHITSLQALRPGNAPDHWEAGALQTIQSGAREFGEIVEFSGAPHYRLMYPLYIEKSCMKCHGSTGYKLGDLRGGISASVPMSKFGGLSRDHFVSGINTFGGIWALGIAGMAVFAPFVGRRIRDQEQAEEALQQNLAFTQSIIDNEPECVKILGPGGVVKFMNRAGLAMIDAEGPEAVLGKPVHSLVVPEHRDAFQRLTEAVLAGGTGSLEFEMIGFKGSRRWLETQVVPLRGTDGTVASALGITRDITERKKAEDALRKSEERLREAQRIGRMGNWELDLSGQSLWWSDEVYSIFGMDPAQGVTFDAFIGKIHADDRSRVQDAVRRSLTAWQVEYRIELDDGTVRHLFETGTADKDGAGRVVRRRGIVQDITERKQAEERRKQLEQQLLQAQKIESIGRLAGGMAHDINNMLMPILGYAEIISMRMPEQDPGRDDLEQIIGAANRVRDMTRQLLAFARKQTLDAHPLNVNMVITQFGRILRRALRENIEIDLRLAPVVRTVIGDERQIEQVLLNLALNAQDSMPGGGRLRIATQDVDVDRAFAEARPGMPPGRQVLITFDDDGAGMDRETLEKIFEPFFTTKEAGRGTGLGLPTVYGIVKQHQGYIGVASATGRGTTFSIYLPAAGDAAAAHPAEDRPGIRRGSETVLVVEDQEEVLRIVWQQLGALGYRVLTAAGSSAARAALGAHGSPPDLLITDVIMPGSNGRELYEELRRAHPALKVLYMSGYPADVISTHGVLDRGVHFLRKPFSVQDLSEKVRKALDGSASETPGTPASV